jgi:hypothetical protein
VQPSTGWQPPFWIRSSSCRPLSNSWFPTEEKSTFMRLSIDDRRLLVEQRVGQRRGADGVAGHHRGLGSAVQALPVGDQLGQVGGAAGVLAVEVQAARLQVAVEVVPGQHVQVGGAARREPARR